MPRNTPRKQRTRQHVIADLGVHHVEGFILEQGHTAQQFYPDYGYDLALFTHDETGYVEPGVLFVQVKASESLQEVEGQYVYDLDIRDYNLWTREEMPVILSLYDASRKRAYWLPIQEYFRRNSTRGPKVGTRTVRVRIPKRQSVKRESMAKMREIKRAAQLPAIYGG